jgi:hypothetical protein
MKSHYQKHIIQTKNNKYLKLAFLLIFIPFLSRGQDPILPPTNLGITNLQDGNAPATGWYYMQYVQLYQTRESKNDLGSERASAPNVNSILAMQQIVHISYKNLFGGKLGFTVIAPIVGFTVTNNEFAGLITNPNPVGDVVVGPLIQWFNKKIFKMELNHRLEVDLGIPIGAYSYKYDINPGSNLYRLSAHHTFTLSPAENLSFSMRNHLNYFFRYRDSAVRSGMSYNFNYSAEYELFKNTYLEIAGYYLYQFEQDSNNGDHRYFQENFGISDTRERVFAVGTGFGHVTSSGLFIEVKALKESGAQNRVEGIRATLVLTYKI